MQGHLLRRRQIQLDGRRGEEAESEPSPGMTASPHQEEEHQGRPPQTSAVPAGTPGRDIPGRLLPFSQIADLQLRQIFPLKRGEGLSPGAFVLQLQSGFQGIGIPGEIPLELPAQLGHGEPAPPGEEPAEEEHHRQNHPGQHEAAALILPQLLPQQPPQHA